MAKQASETEFGRFVPPAQGVACRSSAGMHYKEMMRCKICNRNSDCSISHSDGHALAELGFILLDLHWSQEINNLSGTWPLQPSNSRAFFSCTVGAILTLCRHGRRRCVQIPARQSAGRWWMSVRAVPTSNTTHSTLTSLRLTVSVLPSVTWTKPPNARRSKKMRRAKMYSYHEEHRFGFIRVACKVTAGRWWKSAPACSVWSTKPIMW